jgi:hypothetical protein
LLRGLGLLINLHKKAAIEPMTCVNATTMAAAEG